MNREIELYKLLREQAEHMVDCSEHLRSGDVGWAVLSLGEAQLALAKIVEKQIAPPPIPWTQYMILALMCLIISLQLTA